MSQPTFTIPGENALHDSSKKRRSRSRFMSLPILKISAQSSLKIKTLLSSYPEHLVVFGNIIEDRPLNSSLHAENDNSVVIEALISGIFLPTLLAYEIVARDDSRCCGYRPLYSKIEFEDAAFTHRQKQRFVERLGGVASQAVKFGDRGKRSLGEALYGVVPDEVLEDMFSEIEGVIKKYLRRASRKGSSRFVLAITGTEL